jgi:hypothetical protein
MNFHNSFIIILLINLYLNKNQVANTLECLIHNKEYKYEYLYQSKDMNDLNIYGSKVYLFPLKKLFNLDMIRWSVFSTSDNKTFYLKSL